MSWDPVQYGAVIIVLQRLLGYDPLSDVSLVVPFPIYCVVAVCLHGLFHTLLCISQYEFRLHSIYIKYMQKANHISKHFSSPLAPPLLPFDRPCLALAA